MKVDKFLILIILSILALSFFTSWRFKKLSETLPEIKVPKVQLPNPKSFLPEKEIKEFISPDGKLKFKYSSDWIEMPKESWQETISAEAKILFFATKFKIESVTFASLIVQEISWEGEINEFIEKMKRGVKERGGEMKILNLEIKEREAFFKARYKKEEKMNFISKEKIILEGGKVYLISIFSIERFWSEFDRESEEILNSAHLVL